VKGVPVTVEPGKHALTLPDGAFPLLREFLSLPALAAAPSADASEEPPRDFGMKLIRELKTFDSVSTVEKTEDEKGLLIGTKDGRVTLAGLAPEVRFSMQAGAPVCALLGADVNNDKKQEYFAGTRDPSLLRLDETGKALWERKYDLSYGYADAAAVLARGRYKGRDCLLYGSQGWLVKYLSGDGNLLAKTFVRYHSVTDLAAGDFNNDGKWEIYAGDNYHTPVNLLDENGTRLWHLWDQVGSEARSISAYAGLNCTRLNACDLNGDGRKEAVYGTLEGQIFAFDLTAKRLLYAFVGGPVTDLWAGALTDKAAAPVIAVATRYGDLSLFNARGERLAFTDTKTAILDLEVSDITGDGTRELLLALSDGTLRVFDASLKLHACFSRPGCAQAVKALGKSVFGVYSDGTVVKLEAMKRNPVSGGIHY